MYYTSVDPKYDLVAHTYAYTCLNKVMLTSIVVRQVLLCPYIYAYMHGPSSICIDLFWFDMHIITLRFMYTFFVFALSLFPFWSRQSSVRCIYACSLALLTCGTNLFAKCCTSMRPRRSTNINRRTACLSMTFGAMLQKDGPWLRLPPPRRLDGRRLELNGDSNQLYFSTISIFVQGKRMS